MSTPFNRQIIIGRVSEMTAMESGDVCFVIKSMQNDKVVKNRIRCSGKMAEAVYKHLHNNDLVCVEGRITKPYIIAERCAFLGMANFNK